MVAPFSARGIAGDPNAKPDLVAPGVSMVGLRAPGSVIDTEHPTARVGSANFRGSGTSMATAVASGNVAGLLSELPDLDPNDVKDALTEGAYSVAGGRTASGAGAIDLDAAKSAAEQAEPGPRPVEQPRRRCCLQPLRRRLAQRLAQRRDRRLAAAAREPALPAGAGLGDLGRRRRRRGLRPGRPGPCVGPGRRPGRRLACSHLVGSHLVGPHLVER